MSNWFVFHLVLSLQDEEPGIEGLEDDGMEEDEEALLEAMDAEDAASANLENKEKKDDDGTGKNDGTPPKLEKPTKVCHVCGHKAQSYVSLRNHIMAR